MKQEIQLNEHNKEIKRISDYYEALYELYPEVPKKDIERILNYGWKSLYLHTVYGGDTLILDKDIWCYIGRLTKDSVKHLHYYIKKLTVKLRVLYKRKKIPYTGYSVSYTHLDVYKRQVSFLK